MWRAGKEKRRVYQVRFIEKIQTQIEANARIRGQINVSLLTGLYYTFYHTNTRLEYAIGTKFRLDQSFIKKRIFSDMTGECPISPYNVRVGVYRLNYVCSASSFGIMMTQKRDNSTIIFKMKRGSHVTLSEINYHVTKIGEAAVISRL